MVLKYATTLQLAQSLGFAQTIPEWVVASTPAREEIGTGNNVKTLFYLDYRNILANSYTILSGATDAAATALTETTHYTLAKDTGELTLTASGVTAVGTDKIFGAYDRIAINYSNTSINITDSMLNDILARAELEVDGVLNTIFTDGSATNPTYPSKVEVHDSKGSFDRTYFPFEKPIVDVNSLLASTITAGASTLDVTANDGDNFPATGTIIIGTEKITYTGVSTDTLTGLTRGVDDSTAAAHTAADEIHTTVVEVSGSVEGGSVTYFPLQHKTDVFVDTDADKISVYQNLLLDQVFVSDMVHNKSGVANRFRLTYLHGNNTIPVDITRLTILFAKSSMRNDAVISSVIKGTSGISSKQLVDDEVEISRIMGKYIILPMGNT